MNIVVLIVGFYLLIKGADVFVEGAAAIAKKLKVPSVIVGLTIVSLGTSAPELTVSIMSSLKGSNALAVGNVLGSNFFNILVVLGATVVITPLLIKKSSIRKDFIINILVSVLCFILIFGVSFSVDGLLSRVDGLVLIIGCIAYVLFLIRGVKGSKEEIEEIEEKEVNIRKNIILLIVGVIGIVVGGKLVVDSATSIAYSLGMSEKLVGLTIVAIGTSLPELVTSIVAALKGENEIALGNILGSNIFNILLILGLSAIISPIVVPYGLVIDFAILVIVTLFIGAVVFLNKGEEKKVNRFHGIIFIGIYIVYLVYIIMRN